MEITGSAGNSTTNPRSGWGYSFHAAAVAMDAITATAITRAIGRKAHLLRLCLVWNSWYKKASKTRKHKTQAGGTAMNWRIAGFIAIAAAAFSVRGYAHHSF